MSVFGAGKGERPQDQHGKCVDGGIEARDVSRRAPLHAGEVVERTPPGHDVSSYSSAPFKDSPSMGEMLTSQKGRLRPPVTANETGVRRIAHAIRHMPPTTAQMDGKKFFAARCSRTLDILHHECEQLGLPFTRAYVTNLSANIYGMFEPSTWRIALNIRTLEATSDETFVTVIAHEFRHMEQIFLIARYLAADAQWTPDKISEHLGIPVAVAEEACRRPINLSTKEAVLASTHYEAIYGNLERRSRLAGDVHISECSEASDAAFHELNNFADEQDALDFEKRLTEAIRRQ